LISSKQKERALIARQSFKAGAAAYGYLYGCAIPSTHRGRLSPWARDGGARWHRMRGADKGGAAPAERGD